MLAENDGLKREVWEGEFRNVVVGLGLSTPLLLSDRRSPAVGNVAGTAFASNGTAASPMRSAQDGAFATARKLVISSESEFFNKAALERKIVASKELEAMTITVVEWAGKPDLVIRLGRPLFTFDFTYTVTDLRTNAVVMSGNVTAINDEVASDEIVKKLEARFAAARAVESAQRHGFAR